MLETLPKDVVNLILDYLDTHDIICLAYNSKNKYLYNTINERFQRKYSAISMISNMRRLQSDLSYLTKVVKETVFKNNKHYNDNYGFEHFKCLICNSFDDDCVCNRNKSWCYGCSRSTCACNITTNYCSSCELFNCVCYM